MIDAQHEAVQEHDPQRAQAGECAARPGHDGDAHVVGRDRRRRDAGGIVVVSASVHSRPSRRPAIASGPRKAAPIDGCTIARLRPISGGAREEHRRDRAMPAIRRRTALGKTRVKKRTTPPGCVRRGRAAATACPSSASAPQPARRSRLRIARGRQRVIVQHLPIAERERLQRLVIQRAAGAGAARAAARTRPTAAGASARSARSPCRSARRDRAAQADQGVGLGRRPASSDGSSRSMQERSSRASMRARVGSRPSARRRRLSTTATSRAPQPAGMRPTTISRSCARVCTTSVPASRSPSRRDSGSSSMNHTPTSVSSSRTMLRRSSAPAVARPPSRDTTRRSSAHLPNERPPVAASTPAK